MNKIAYNIFIPIVFPEGVHPGAGKEGNRSFVTMDGAGRPVLRGSALAGVLRSAYYETGKVAATWFGEAFNKNERDKENPLIEDDRNECGKESPLIVDDATFEQELAALPEQTHNAHNRHTGAVYKNALFSMQRIPANAKARLRLALVAEEHEKAEVETFLKDIVALFAGGLYFGGSVARGIGRAALDGDVLWKAYTLAEPEGIAAWLNDNYALRKNRKHTPAGSKTLEVAFEWGTEPTLRVELTLKPARGQDFLVAEGADMSPLQRTDADGQTQWVLPGSTLRGNFRQWMARLAARAKHTLTDSHANAANSKYDLIGWGGISDKKKREEFQENPAKLGDPILSLFGSLYARSRIHFSDGLAKTKEEQDKQKRVHVAIDAISGGAIESLLFDNFVLTAGEFPIVITIGNPRGYEADWLKQTLTALNLGLIRLGSSKASGRFEITALKAQGQFAETITVKGV